MDETEKWTGVQEKITQMDRTRGWIRDTDEVHRWIIHMTNE